jgi:hypothetical protein
MFTVYCDKKYYMKVIINCKRNYFKRNLKFFKWIKIIWKHTKSLELEQFPFESFKSVDNHNVGIKIGLRLFFFFFFLVVTTL